MLTLPPQTPTSAAEALFRSLSALGEQGLAVFHSVHRDTDAQVLLQAGVPALVLTDARYPAWHTADDTAEQLDALALQKVGAIVVHLLKHRPLP